MNVDLKKYDSDGYIIIKDFLNESELNEFELNISNFTDAQISKLGIPKSSNDPLIDLFNRGGDYRKKLYDAIQELVIFEKIKIRLYDDLDKSGVLSKLDFKVPILRSGLFVSMPNEEFLDNPVHQDIYSFISTKFLRFWIPLRKVDNFHGSMRVWPKSHKNGFIPPDDYTNLTYPTFKKKNYKHFSNILIDSEPGPCVMFNPMLFHSTVSNFSNIVRFSLSIDIIDLAEFGDFNDVDGEFRKMTEISKNRKSKRSSSDSYKKL
jgi:ectoine hydroxylase-related dioxygenase (phytanoyl-CoA dioxygenase family)